MRGGLNAKVRSHHTLSSVSARLVEARTRTPGSDATPSICRNVAEEE